MPRCLLALGANLGDPAAALRNAALECHRLEHSRILARSSWHATLPVGGPAGQCPFLNGALLLETQLEPTQLLEFTSRIEQMAGRQRTERWGARTLDVDLLLYDQLACETDQLVLPHPRMSFRRFVLGPAVEIAPEMIHPESSWTLASLLRHLQQPFRTVVVTAPIPEWAEWLANWLGGVLNCSAATGFSPGGSPPHVPLQICTIELPKMESLAAAALVVAIDPHDPDIFRERLRTGRRLAAESAPQSTIAKWHATVARPGYGPRARIRASNPEIIQQEALAAIEAAWPDLTTD